MPLEEKFEALMKSYQTIATSNQELKQGLEELKGQNAYLCKQLGESIKLKKKLFQSPSGSAEGEGSEVEGQQRELSSKEEAPRILRENEDLLFLPLMTLKLKYLKLKGSSILISFMSVTYS